MTTDILKYIKLRDIIIAGTVAFFVLGPAAYHLLESMNDIETNTELIDFSSLHSGTERQIYQIKHEALKLRLEISESKPFGWREVYHDFFR